jgi:uncharacterized phage-like protein YoqJ
LTLKKRSLKLTQQTQEELQLLNNKLEELREEEVNYNYNDEEQQLPSNKNNYIIDKSRVNCDYDTEKIDEIGFLLQKMFEAQEYTKTDLEGILFSELDFSNENFQEELTRRIVTTLIM